MKEIILNDIKVPVLLDIVGELRDQGWKMGKDFDWTYHPADISDRELGAARPHAVFAFYTEKYATFFVLKYLHHIK